MKEEVEQKSQGSLVGELLFNLSLDQVNICLEEKLDLNLLYLLESYDREIDLSKYAENPKFDGWKQTLIRKSLINENGKVLNAGKMVLELIHKQMSRKAEKLTKNVSDEETAFDRWWKTYPGTDNFVINSKYFKGSRSFRVEKDACRLLYNRILNSGEYTETELLEAIKLEVENRKDESYRTGENKLKYLKNTGAYLRQYAFDAYVELIRKGFKAQDQSKTNQTDYSGGVSI